MGKLLEHDNTYVRSSAAAAFVEAVERWPASITETIHALLQLYHEKVAHRTSQCKRNLLSFRQRFWPQSSTNTCAVGSPQNSYTEISFQGLVDERSLGRTDPWQARLAIAQTLEYLAPVFSEEVTVPFFNFLVKEEALGDRNAEVRRGMLSAGSAVIDYHGSRHLAALITMFETHLAGAPSTSEAADFIQEAVVISFGRVARHLDSSDARLPTILTRLVESLKTP